MSQAEVERLLGRLITDAGFRKKAEQSLCSASYAEGFALSDEEVRFLEKLNFSCFSLLEETLDDSIRRT